MMENKIRCGMLFHGSDKKLPESFNAFAQRSSFRHRSGFRIPQNKMSAHFPTTLFLVPGATWFCLWDSLEKSRFVIRARLLKQSVEPADKDRRRSALLEGYDEPIIRIIWLLATVNLRAEETIT
jgi:hypothetical protein